MTNPQGPAETTAIRTCPLCEAVCGLQITLRDGRVSEIRGDDEDVFSHGYLCPKGTTLGALHEDPDRVRVPLVKRDGVFVEVTWDEALGEVSRRLQPILAEHGRDAVAVYLGNPNAHNFESVLYAKPLVKAIGTHNVFSASTVDQRPKEIASALMFGTPLTVAVPDLDRTAYLLMLGANPLESNGSLATAPDWPGRMKAIRARGGKIVCVDPRRTRTALASDEHLAIKPGGDAFFLAALANTLLAEGLTNPGRLREILRGADELAAALKPFTADAVAGACGIDAETIRRIARELAAASSACVYGRMGTTTQRFGTLSSWLVDVLNVLTGNLDREGGAMFTKAAAGATNTRGSRPTAEKPGRSLRTGRFRSRVRGLAETMGELPVACLAEEITTPGDGQVRALITIAGNPVVSTPDAGALDAAIASLDFMISVDIYVNETTKHADVLLPPPSALQRSHYDLAFWQLSVRNAANYSPAVHPLDDGALSEWEILAKLALIAQGMPAQTDVSVADDFVCTTVVQQAIADPGSPVAGRSADEIFVALQPRIGPERLLDLLLRTGPYGDGFGADPDGLTLAALEAKPHGIDLGPLKPRLPDALRTADGLIDMAPALCLDDLPRMQAALADAATTDADSMVLVGRRHLRSNNSWLHNIPAMMKGKERCTVQIHPDDAARLGLKDGLLARVTSAVGSLEAPVEITEDIRPGVVSLPHGWGHDEGVQLGVASSHPGVNSNLLTDAAMVDVPTGNAVLNGIPVQLAPAF